MSDSISVPARWAALQRGFAGLEPVALRSRLIDYAHRLPPLPAGLAGGRRLDEVQECATPLFLAAAAGEGGTVRLYLDAPHDAPTTRAVAGIIHELMDGGTPEDVAGVPDDMFERLGLQAVLTEPRVTRLAALVARVKRLVAETSEPAGRAGRRH